MARVGDGWGRREEVRQKVFTWQLRSRVSFELPAPYNTENRPLFGTWWSLWRLPCWSSLIFPLLIQVWSLLLASPCGFCPAIGWSGQHPTWCGYGAPFALTSCLGNSCWFLAPGARSSFQHGKLNSKFTTKEQFEGRISKAKDGGAKAITKQNCEILQKGDRVLCLLSSREYFTFKWQWAPFLLIRLFVILDIWWIDKGEAVGKGRQGLRRPFWRWGVPGRSLPPSSWGERSLTWEENQEKREHFYGQSGTDASEGSWELRTDRQAETRNGCNTMNTSEAKERWERERAGNYLETMGQMTCIVTPKPLERNNPSLPSVIPVLIS